MAGIVDQALLVMYLVLLLNVAIGIGISLMYLGVIGWIFSLLFYQGKMFASISATVVHQQNGIIVSKKRQYTVILSLLFAVLSCTFRYCLSNISVEICSTMLYSVTHLYPEQAIDAFFVLRIIRIIIDGVSNVLMIMVVVVVVLVVVVMMVIVVKAVCEK